MIQDHLSVIEKIQKDEQETLASIKEGCAEPELLRLKLAEEMLNQASEYIQIDAVSQATLNKKNIDVLNEARKSFNKCLTYLESVVTKLVDAPFSEYEKELNKISSFSPTNRYHLIKKMVLVMELLKNAYAGNPKWKWTMVELEGRSAVVAKNIINLREVPANTDLRSPHYESTAHHLSLAKKLLMDAADYYRKKYEAYSNSIEDFKMATNLLTSLVRFNIITGDQENATLIKKKLIVWNNKLNMDIKNMQLKKK